MTEFFIYVEYPNDDVSRGQFSIVKDESRLPANKLAARVTLTDDRYRHLVSCDWYEYQELLEHYFEHNQKLVTA
jgi:hypothetical protein